jgi:NhaP-type Na+/H+ or K+/H+ antiporter
MVTGPVSASQIFAGLALIVGVAVGCQIIAARFGVPAIILLLPARFGAGALTTVVNPDKIFGAAFPPLVSLAVAIILFDGGLDLVAKGLAGDSRRVVRRLRGWSIPMAWAGAGFFGGLLLGCPRRRPSCSARS